MNNYDTITVMPIPHLNLVNFIGMGNKKDQLIWREKRGFFTTLSRQGDLSTWSTLTGKLLYTLKPEGEASVAELKDYMVYRANKKDITYTQNFYNHKDYSLNLLCSRKPVRLSLCADDKFS